MSRHHRCLSALESLEGRLVPSAYLATDLVSDQPGVARVLDPNLVNAWGIALSPTGAAFWVSSNGADLSDLYIGDVNGSALTKVPLQVDIPGGAPTGQVFNSTADFVVSNGLNSAAALFIFAGETGQVTGWNPTVPPNTTAKPGFTAPDGAIYKGIALANNGTGNFLYLADFHNGKIDVLDSQYQLTHLAGNFTDPNLPRGFAPFNVAAIGGKLYVTYARQDATATDDLHGPGLGLVDVFDTNGNFDKRLVTRGHLNAPWGMVLAPANFGEFSNDLLVGNFGNGWVNAYDPSSGAFRGSLSIGTTVMPTGMGMTMTMKRPLVIDGLWGLAFGNGVTAGDANTLYFSAGPGDEQHGLFGKITANANGTNPVTATLANGTLSITGSRNNDAIVVGLDRTQEHITVVAGGQRIGAFAAVDVATIQFSGFAGNDQISVSPAITATTVLDGGAGNDVLSGGGGSNILLGGPGVDALIGRGSRDILIGGEGRDLLSGGAGDDILISGTTTHDGNTVELLQILNAWNSGDTYTNRIATIRAGAGVPKLDATTVLNDGVLDLVLGGLGLDWFWTQAPDLTPGRLGFEQVD